MFKIRDFFKNIYKGFYNSDPAYLMSRIIYVVICTVLTIVCSPNKPAPLEDVIFGTIGFWTILSIILLPIFFILYGATTFFVDTIKSKLRR